MNPAPAAVTRTSVHTRAVTYRGFARSDGLWDIEGRLVDTKDFPIERPGGRILEPGSPAHDMFIRVTLDDALKVVDIQTSMDATPLGECLNAAPPMRKLIGATLGRGWRKNINEALGDESGCTHLRELLFNLATAAFQTIPSYIQYQRQQRGEPPVEFVNAPHFIGQCMTWRRGGPAVQNYYPKFYAARPQSDLVPEQDPDPA